MVCANFIDYGAMFDIKVVELLVPAVKLQASALVGSLHNGFLIDSRFVRA